MGGRIYGDGQGSTMLTGTGTSLFQINGMSQTIFEDFSARMDGFSSTNRKAVFYMDWDGTGSVGLNNIMLFNIAIESVLRSGLPRAAMGVRTSYYCILILLLPTAP
jgi:hypothetical protein